MLEKGSLRYVESHKNIDEKKMSLPRKFFYLFGFLLFSMMIVTPSAYQILKAVLIFVIFVGILLDLIINKRRRLHPLIFQLFIFYILLGLIFGIYGYLRQNLGAIPITKEVVFYVILYMILICGIVDYASMKYIHKILVFSMAFLCLYLVASVLNAYGIWPDWLYYSLQTETSIEDVSIDTLGLDGRLYASFRSFPNLLFLQPYLFCFIITQPEKKSKLMWLLFFAMTIIMVFVGRRILMIIAILSPIIIIITLNLFRKNNALKVINWKSVIFYSVLVLSGLVFIIIKISGINVQSTVEYFLFSFQSIQITPSGEIVSNVRLDTIYQLFNGWKESPIFGFGNGASYPNFLRNKAEPWNYEVIYMQFLYSWGILGFTLYGMGIYFIIKKLIKIYKENSVYSRYAISSLMGMVAFLIGCATNPYLLAFDALYIIFLPVAIINIHHLKQ